MRSFRLLLPGVLSVSSLLAACNGGGGETRRRDDDGSGDTSIFVDASDGGNDSSGPDAGIDSGEDTIDPDGFGPDTIVPDTDPDVAPDVREDTIEPPECVDDVDCRGGQLCVDGDCRDICTDDLDCAGGQFCDSEGVCRDIDCRDDGDCGPRQRCEEFACIDLPPGQILLDPVSLSLTALGRGSGHAASDLIHVTNDGEGDLSITRISAVGADEISALSEAPVVLPPGGETWVTVTYTASSFGGADGDIEIVSDDPDAALARVPVTGTLLRGDIAPSTTTLNFGNVAAGGQQELVIGNMGEGFLTIESLEFSGTEFTLVGAPALPHEIAPGDEWGVTVRTVRGTVVELNDTLAIGSDDPTTPSVDVELVANVATPCVQIFPGESIPFGSLGVGENTSQLVEISNCSTSQTLRITSISLAGDPEFEIVSLPTLPLNLTPGSSRSVEVSFMGDFAGDYDGVLTVNSNDPVRPRVDVALSASVEDFQCPIAVAGGRPAGTAGAFSPSFRMAALGSIELTGASSSDPDGGAITGYAWTVVSRPTGASASFAPNSTSATVTYNAALDGDYTFRLDVTDDEGTASCSSAFVTVSVGTPVAVTATITWVTPADANPSDTNGADVDITMRNGTTGGWSTSSANICSYVDRETSWGAQLVVDDLNGEGPETITLRSESGTFSIGVEYWDDHGFGTSTVDLVVTFSDGSERRATRTLTDKQFWVVSNFGLPGRSWTLVDQVYTERALAP